MLSVRLTEPVERALQSYCTEHAVSKSHVVQEALAEWLGKARWADDRSTADALSFLAADDPLRQAVGIIKQGPSTDEWMASTRGDDWNKP